MPKKLSKNCRKIVEKWSQPRPGTIKTQLKHNWKTGEAQIKEGKTMLSRSDMVEPTKNLRDIKKNNSTAKALKGGCLSKPQSKLLPHARASMVSKGKLIFEKVGTNVQTIK